MKHALTVAMLLLAATIAAAGQPDPALSIYQLQVRLTDQSGREHALDVHRGHPVLVAMFYGSCPMTCPLIIDTLRSIENAVPARRNDLRVLLISIDPERDTPARLSELAVQRRIDTSRWTLSRASEPDVRKIAAVLNLQYRRLPNGEFNHSSAVVLLSSDGVMTARSERLNVADPALVQALRATEPES